MISGSRSKLIWSLIVWYPVFSKQGFITLSIVLCFLHQYICFTLGRLFTFHKLLTWYSHSYQGMSLYISILPSICLFYIYARAFARSSTLSLRFILFLWTFWFASHIEKGYFLDCFFHFLGSHFLDIPIISLSLILPAIGDIISHSFGITHLGAGSHSGFLASSDIALRKAFGV